ncbi:DUF2007 domain-containing protein [Parabacteroides sp. 52]|uniref:putative signal transducing protein n=1 Tax=unclassified Parabacteroides TaxID=2649774 RepID=UPI0013D4532F|nr:MULTISPECIES: DUF2007 domain-containing protein [unclassified Parabacteroides]MDH6535643.1 hypothetical protein [Parabacteroides sp. PM5-20]NDV56282.1 DUF2007 domain-containing protein [Parabacteroides sp. 52]
MSDTEKMVEVARFTYASDAQVLASLLKSEGIDCYIRNELITQVLAGIIDLGGARVELLESEVSRALEIMQENGYEIPGENEEACSVQTMSRWARHIPLLNKLPLEKQLFFMFFLIALLLTALVYASKLLH